MSQFKRYMEMINEGRVGQRKGYLDKKEEERSKGGFFVEKPDMTKEPDFSHNGPKRRRKDKRSESGTTGGLKNDYKSGVKIIPDSMLPTEHEKRKEEEKKEKATADYYNSRYAEKGLAVPGREKELFKKARKYINEKNTKMLDLLEKHTVLADIPINDLKKTIKEIEKN